MPVHDHEIHESVRHGDDFRYGCHSSRNPRGRSEGYWVKVRDYANGQFDMIDDFIDDRSSELCRYANRPDDLNCRGCQNESDIAYLKGYGL